MFSARRCLSTQPLRPVVSSAARPRLLRQYAQKRVPSERSSLLPQSSSLTDFRMRIMSAANLGSTNDCLQLAASMKQANLTPDASTYNAILSVLAKDRLHQFAWAVLEDMKKMGIRPDATAYSNFIQAHAYRGGEQICRALSELKSSGVQPTASVYSAIINVFLSVKNVEGALQHYFLMQSHNLTPELAVVQDLILLLAESQLPRLALDIASSFEKETQRRIDASIWLECLYSSAQNLYLDGVNYTWHLVKELGITPNEGICLAVINTAARHGAPELAADVLQSLKELSVRWQDHHFDAVIEAFCRNNQLKEALVTLKIMVDNEVRPSPGVLSTISRISLQDSESIDRAWDTLETLKQEGNFLPLHLNLLINASIELKDLQRAMGIYKSFDDYSVVPTLAIFHSLFDGCIAAHHRQLGDLLLGDMKKYGLEPNAVTFATLIQLCLTQDAYEDAFFYLEEMKASGRTPPRPIYVNLVYKCWSVNDPRVEMVLDEMKECGYNLPRRPTTETSEEETLVSTSSSPPMLDAAAIEAINTGGTR